MVRLYLPTFHFVFQVANDSDRLMQDHQFCLGLLTLQVLVTDFSKFLERLVNVSHTNPGRYMEENTIW